MRGTLAIGILLVIVVPARAQDDPKVCAHVVDDAKRLVCYDLVFRTMQTTATQGKWKVLEAARDGRRLGKLLARTVNHDAPAERFERRIRRHAAQ